MSEQKIWLFHKTIERIHCINHWMGQQPTWIGPTLMGFSLYVVLFSYDLPNRTIVHFMSTCFLSPINFSLLIMKLLISSALNKYLLQMSFSKLFTFIEPLNFISAASLIIFYQIYLVINIIIVVQLFRHFNKTTILK